MSKYLKDEHKNNIIQEFILLNDENVHDCTEIMSEFHKHIENWWKKIETWERASNNHVHNLEKIYLKENIIKYENFISVSCQRDDVQVTMSEILYKFMHNENKIIQRIILSWFIIINDNDQTLDNEKSNS